jgi:hypothetical protein
MDILYSDIIRIITSYLDNPSKWCFSMTCKQFLKYKEPLNILEVAKKDYKNILILAKQIRIKMRHEICEIAIQNNNFELFKLARFLKTPMHIGKCYDLIWDHNREKEWLDYFEDCDDVSEDFIECEEADDSLNESELSDFSFNE